METVYEAAGGELGMLLLARAWHERVMIDDVVAHAFARGFHPDHDVRLAAYWGEALGGPPTYSERYGDETAVVRIHSGNGPHEEMNERAIACFDLALADVGIGEDDPVHRVLHDYFAWMTPFVNRFEASAADVPDGLTVQKWSWDGRLGDPDAGGVTSTVTRRDPSAAAAADTVPTAPAADTPTPGPRELIERLVIARDASRLADYCDPELVLTVDGRTQDLAAFAAARRRGDRSETTYAVQYDDAAWVEDGDRLGARLWITTTRGGQAAERVEVVLLARVRAGRLYRLSALTRSDRSDRSDRSHGSHRSTG